MTTFQAIVYGIVHGFSEFLPISASAHHILVPYLFHWPAPSGALLGALSLGTFLAVMIYFLHDWASIISSFLQILIFRRRPQSLDERLPFFIILTTLPGIAAWYYFGTKLEELVSDPLITAAVLAGAGLPLWFADTMNRKNKGMYDWNWLDSLITGACQALLIVPGAGRVTGAMLGASMRNYRREAAAKFVFFSSAPILFGSTFLRLREVNFHAPMPMADMSWISFVLAILMSFLAGMLAIGGFMKHVQKTGNGGGMGRYFVYRCIVATVIGAVFWIRSRSG